MQGKLGVIGHLSKLQSLLRDVSFGAVLMVQNSFLIEAFQIPLIDCCLKSVQLQRVFI